MTHIELSAAVHELGIQYGSHDTHTSEELSVGLSARPPYYFAQVWFSRAGDGDFVCEMGDSAEAVLEKTRIALNRRLFNDKSLHPMARHAALLMAAEVQS